MILIPRSGKIVGRWPVRPWRRSQLRVGTRVTSRPRTDPYRPNALALNDQAIAVMLDFVNPQRAGRWPGHLRRLARLENRGTP